MFDPDAWIWALLVVTVGVVSLSALACAVALVRDTTGHDWYATGKVTLTELLIGIGYDNSALTEYRNWRGEVESLTRDELRNNADAGFARRHLLRTARKAAELGACCGIGGALLCLAVFGRQDRGQARRPVPEPAPPRWPGTPGESASPQTTAVSERDTAGSRSGQPVTAAAVAVREPPVRPPDSQTREAGEPEPKGKRDSGKGAGKTGERPTARRTRRKRNYDRWI